MNATQPTIELRWPTLDVSVEATLAEQENPELVADFVASLPFQALQEHAAVTGSSMYAWTPVVSVAPIRVREKICEAPVGRLRFSQNTGQKLIIQYGPTTEDIYAPVLGQVLPEHCDRLKTVGRAAWESLSSTKAEIPVEVRLAG
jgi:hypothetical protein